MKHIGKSPANDERGRLVHVHVDAPAHFLVERPQIVDAMGVVGVGMGHQDAVDPLDPGLDHLLAQIGRGVDEDRGRAVAAEALDEHRAASAAVFRV